MSPSLRRLVRLFLFLVFGIVLGGSAALSYAGTVKYQLRGVNVTREGGATYLRGTSPSELTASNATVSGGWFQGVGAVVLNGGKTATWAQKVELATTAASVASKAVRVTPQGLVVGAVASWLLSKGLQYVDGKWMASRSQATAGATYYWSSFTSYGPMTLDGFCSLVQATGCYFDGQVSGSQKHACIPRTSGSCAGAAWATPVSPGSCPQGLTLVGDTCSGSTAATDADWVKAASEPLPDAAAKELIFMGVKLPVNDPATIDPPYVDVPVSDPYVDPVTGNRYQDKARVSPSKTSDDATVDYYREQVDATGNTVKDANGNPVRQDQADKQPDPVPGDMPAVPELYKQKYPDGLKGVITGAVTQLKATPLFGLVVQLIPTNLPNAGQCPSWSLSMNFGRHMNEGTHVVQPPCWVWDVVKAIMIVSALLLARRLIFGG